MEGASWTETLQLALWLVDQSGTKLNNWVMTDRLRLQRQTIEPVVIDEYARWVAVRSYCLGTPLAESRNVSWDLRPGSGLGRPVGRSL